MAEQPLAASAPEDIFVELFCQTFGLESAQYLTPQYPFTDVYGGGRFIDYALQTEQENIAFEIDSEVYHAPFTVTPEKWEDDLLRQNSLIHQRWRVFRWTDRQLAERPEQVQEELAIFLHALRFTARDDYLLLALLRLADATGCKLQRYLSGFLQRYLSVMDARTILSRCPFSGIMNGYTCVKSESTVVAFVGVSGQIPLQFTMTVAVDDSVVGSWPWS